jgi:hypothetical protein
MGGRNNGNGYNQAKKIFQAMMKCQKPKKRQPQTIIEIIDLKIPIMEVLILKNNFKIKVKKVQMEGMDVK